MYYSTLNSFSQNLMMSLSNTRNTFISMTYSFSSISKIGRALLCVRVRLATEVTTYRFLFLNRYWAVLGGRI